MQLHRGPVPDSPDFQPLDQGWSGIREPGPLLVQLLALPIGTLVLALLTLPVLLVAPALLSIDRASLPLVPLVIVLVVSIPVHELIHALSHPGGGRTDETYIGVWPVKGVFYAHYGGAMSRNHFLWVFLTPILVLSLFPLALVLLFHQLLPQGVVICLAALSAFNGVAASGDVLGVILIATQVPRTAKVRNKGWETYWKLVTLGRTPGSAPTQE
jgi:hypothetical protein